MLSCVGLNGSVISTMMSPSNSAATKAVDGVESIAFALVKFTPVLISDICFASLGSVMS